MIKPVFSIIIPVYNTKVDLLVKCIESIMHQTFINYECIIVNDGSTNKPTLIHVNSIHDPRFKIINQTNQGQGAARNRGISESSGKYIVFLDSDDFVDKNFLQTVFNITNRSNADIVCTKITKILYEQNNKKENYIPLDILDGFIEKHQKNKLIQQFVIWNKVYKRSLFKDILFPSIKNEDIFVLYITIFKAKTIFYTTRTSYNYTIHSESDVNSFRQNTIDEKSIHYIFDAIDVFDMIFSFYKVNEKRYHISYFKSQLLQNAYESLKYRRNLISNDKELVSSFDKKLYHLLKKYDKYFSVNPYEIIQRMT